MKAVPTTTEMTVTAMRMIDKLLTSSHLSDVPWDPSDPAQWDFAHGPRFDEWTGRTGEYCINGCCCASSSIQLWRRAVPALAWVDSDTRSSWLKLCFECIRLVVVDQLGIRRPYPGDPLEEAACESLVGLSGAKATLLEEHHRWLLEETQRVKEASDNFRNLPRLDEKLLAWDSQAYFDHICEFEEFLEVQDLGDGRLVAAFGSGASFPRTTTPCNKP